MVELDAPIRHHRGVALFYQESPYFVVEYHQQHGMNAVSFQQSTGYQSWYIVGCYLVPDNASYIEVISGSMEQRPCVVTLILFGDRNADITDPKDNQCD